MKHILAFFLALLGTLSSEATEHQLKPGDSPQGKNGVGGIAPTGRDDRGQLGRPLGLSVRLPGRRS